MKKITLFIAMAMCALVINAQDYGILVNGNTYFAGESAGEFEGFTQYLAHVQVKNGDKLQLYDATNKAAWAVALNSYSEKGFTYDAAAGCYTAEVEGCYDFYIKLKWEADELYIGPGENCGTGTLIEGTDNPGSDNPGTDNPGTTTGGNPRYYYKGYIDGEEVEPTDATLFTNGMAALTVYSDAYLFVIYQVDGQPGVQYMTTDYVDGPTHATLVTTGFEKMHVTAGTYTLYLYDNQDGTLELSTEPMAGKTLVSTGTEGLEQTKIEGKARKVIVDGQLRIVRGNKVFDLTGRQL